MDPIVLFTRTAVVAADLARKVAPQQMAYSTPCDEWDVAALLEHMAGGPNYLLAALGVAAPSAERWPSAQVIDTCIVALRAPGALERRCQSPADFEWSVAEAAAGTAMDQYIHTWDLATALGEHPEMDSDIAEAIASMFLPHMPEIGRQAGLVGPAVTIDSDAPALHRLLGAMDAILDADPLDDAIRAMSHPGRRAMLRLARDDERTASQLAAAAGLSPSAASPHLKVLRDAGLMHMRVDARRRLYRVDFERLALVRHALSDLWDERLDELKRLVESRNSARGSKKGRSA